MYPFPTCIWILLTVRTVRTGLAKLLCFLAGNLDHGWGMKKLFKLTAKQDKEGTMAEGKDLFMPLNFGAHPQHHAFRLVVEQYLPSKFLPALYQSSTHQRIQFKVANPFFHLTVFVSPLFINYTLYNVNIISWTVSDMPHPHTLFNIWCRCWFRTHGICPLFFSPSNLNLIHSLYRICVSVVIFGRITTQHCHHLACTVRVGDFLTDIACNICLLMGNLYVQSNYLTFTNQIH